MEKQTTPLDLSCYDWFAPEMKRPESNTALQPLPTGTFMIRGQTNAPGEYALSVKFASNVKHFKICRTGDHKYKIENHQIFNTLPELLDYYEDNPVIAKIDTKEGCNLCTPYKCALKELQSQKSETADEKKSMSSIKDEENIKEEPVEDDYSMPTNCSISDKDQSLRQIAHLGIKKKSQSVRVIGRPKDKWTEIIKDLDDQQITQIQNLERRYKVTITISKEHGYINLRGNIIGISEVRDKIKELCFERKEAELLYNQVQWGSLDDKENFIPYPVKINATIERAYTKKDPFITFKDDSGHMKSIMFETMQEETVGLPGQAVKVKRIYFKEQLGQPSNQPIREEIIGGSGAKDPWTENITNLDDEQVAEIKSVAERLEVKIEVVKRDGYIWIQGKADGISEVKDRISKITLENERFQKESALLYQKVLWTYQDEKRNFVPYPLKINAIIEKAFIIKDPFVTFKTNDGSTRSILFETMTEQLLNAAGQRLKVKRTALTDP